MQKVMQKIMHMMTTSTPRLLLQLTQIQMKDIARLFARKVMVFDHPSLANSPAFASQLERWMEACAWRQPSMSSSRPR